MVRGVPSSAMFDSNIPTGYGSIPASRAASIDFRQFFLVNLI